MEKSNICVCKNAILEKKYSKMNADQKKAVFTTNGPLLILAGAGSGKTTVLVNRIEFMVNFGNAYHSDLSSKSLAADELDFISSYKPGDDEQRIKALLSVEPIKPWNILAITFTNKAASELKERLDKSLGSVAADINAGTFHSCCVRILRRDIERLGYNKSFTIYDTDDSVRVIKDCLNEFNLSDKMFPPKALLSQISAAKDSLIFPDEYEKSVNSDFRKEQISNVYKKYQQKLKLANALDFDDIIIQTVILFQQNPDVLEYYQNRYKYILVDEYQDTNNAQYILISLLSKAHSNLCVVGDDDQSIYKFRGATIKNILDFENQFTNATVIKLEQNYRSTQNILDSANAIISNNSKRKGKSLWTNNGDGHKVFVRRLLNEQCEANFIADTITDNVANGKKYNDHAVLYRMNSQSNSIERGFVKAGIPYKIVGGTKFFERKEIKDMISYLSVINNTADSIRLKRIINEPKRGIGNSTINILTEISSNLNISMFDVICEADKYPDITRKSASLVAFSGIIKELIELSENVSLSELLDAILEKTGYLVALQAEGELGKPRIENINELKSSLNKYSQENESPTLSGFLEEVSLYTDLDNLNVSDDYVVMMTLHSAKGLEFPVVFIAGMEEGIFPGINAINSPEEIEEERRLAYVGVTRAKEMLYITNVAERMLFGSTSRNRPSRYISEIPDGLIDYQDNSIVSYNFSNNTDMFVSKKSALNVKTVGIKNKVCSAVIDYSIGDRVKHKVFGEGTVLNLTPMGGDKLAEIAFDSIGTKKIMANFAKVTKI